MSNVEFLGEKETNNQLMYTKQRVSEAGGPLIRLVMKTGIAKSKSGANIILVVLFIILASFTAYNASQIFTGDRVSPPAPPSLTR